jgi:uncharacterized protein YjbI with pentapeptide repeats
VRSIAGFVLVVALAVGAAPALAQTVSPVTERLEQQKLREEIKQLQLQNEADSGWKESLSTWVAPATAAAALIGVLVAGFGFVHQRGLDRDQRERESVRRLDERFSSILTDLGATNQAVQAGAGVSLLTFLRPEQEAYHRQVRLVTLANLKVRKADDPVRELLVTVLERALRMPAPLEPAEVDFDNAYLKDADLSSLDLGSATLIRANLKGASLQDAKLHKARAYRAVLERAYLAKTDLSEADLDEVQAPHAVFHESNLTSAKLRRADLSGAGFESALLQSAHLEGADLRGARFQNADVKDTYFGGAIFDDRALETLVNARHLWDAHYSPETNARLHELDAARAQG